MEIAFLLLYYIFCRYEPTVEITLPGRRPVLYGHVTAERVAELVERQIVRGETAEGLIEA